MTGWHQIEIHVESEHPGDLSSHLFLFGFVELIGFPLHAIGRCGYSIFDNPLRGQAINITQHIILEMERRELTPAM
jgi:hypothetical protein